MKIKIESMLMGVAATSAILGGMAFQSSSAQAIELKSGDNISLDGSMKISKSLDTFNFIFNDSNIKQRVNGPASTIPPFVDNDLVTLQDLSSLAPGDIFGPIASFITGIALNDDITTDTAIFNLIRGKFVDNGPNSQFYNLVLRGEFVSSTNQILGEGSLSTQLSKNQLRNLNNGDIVKTTLSSSLTVVPTPAAVLPALLGMGTAAFRKKKREGEGELAIAGAEEA